MNIKRHLRSGLAIASLIFSQYAQAQSPKANVEKIFTALQQKDSLQLRGLLPADYTIAGLDSKTSKAILSNIVTGFPGFNSFTIAKDSLEGANHRFKVLLNYTNGKTGRPDVLTDATGKILELNIIRDPKVTNASPNVWPAHVELPAQIVNNCLYVKGKLNGKSGVFMIDNGAFGLIVNPSIAQSNTADTTNYADQLGVSGVNGKVEDVKPVKVSEITVGDIKLHNITLMSMPMEANINTETNLGLLGYAFLKAYKTTLNYRKATVTFNKSDSLKRSSNLKNIAFDMQHHLPVVTALINGKTYHLALDCGASHNILFSDYNKDWQSAAPKMQTETMSGIEGKITNVTVANIPKVTIGGINFTNMATAFTKNNMYSKSEAAALKIDGILGAPFFNTYLLTLDYQNKTVLVEKYSE